MNEVLFSGDMVLEPNLPRPKLCLKGIIRHEVNFTVNWRECIGMSYTTRRNITIYNTNDLRVIVNVVNQDDEAMDIQDAQSIRWWVAKNKSEYPSIVKSLGSTISLGGPSIFYFDLDSDDMKTLAAGEYYHEAEIITYQGRVYTIMSGIFYIKPNLIKT